MSPHSSCKIQPPSHSLQGLHDLPFWPSWPPFTLFQHSLCTPQPLCLPSCFSSMLGCFHSRTQWESSCEPSHNWFLLPFRSQLWACLPWKVFLTPMEITCCPQPHMHTLHGVPQRFLLWNIWFLSMFISFQSPQTGVQSSWEQGVGLLGSLLHVPST